MAELSAIARPYAQAAFKVAVDKKALPAWEAFLHTAEQIILNPDIYRLITNTRISPKQWFDLLTDVLSSSMDEPRKNFLHLIIENKRLSAFPAIAKLFKEYQTLYTQEADVQVTTAIPLDEKYKQKIMHALKNLFNHTVNLHCHVDEHIVGGAIIRAGDKVIDGSVRSQLNRLLEFAIR